MRKDENILVIKGLEKSFKGQLILQDVNLSISKGEIVGIVGSNGSGKTTLLKLILGLSYPEKGDIMVRGKRVFPGLLGDLPTRVGALIENPTFLPQFSGIKNLTMLASIRKEIGKSDIENAMKEMGLDPNNKKAVSKYSLGMRQRLGIAQAIMEKPELVLFDEPTNGLDSDGVELFSKVVNRMKAEGVSFIIVSHRKDEIDSLCDTIYKIENRGLHKVNEYPASFKENVE
ncbi:MAG: ABC transporter ATP-binding protein [Clostridiales bacterium]|uniref:ABC transporter ATP-binding protein n=1 Tax=Clostridium sp. N3C TaxID=1776758 RepID=UPI00092DFCE1|nr:ABC transporter ATP-binding protein [Clostridium sp. N3C]NLZ49582.1 ABC transporter ATP-binding protein [Clostridiales bacterium]SCN22821.1 Fe(3+) ions import ATP-binding protein FbpC 2 [Clostridium sp. N3C]